MTGYSFFDLATGGLRPTECLIVGSETGGGKTQMLINLARSIWMQNNTLDMEDNFEKGYNIQVFSLEVPRQELVDREIASIANVPQRSIRDATLTKEEESRVARTLKFINNYPYTLDIIDVPRGLSVKQLESIYNDSKSKYTPDVIIVDYLSLMQYDGSEDQDWLKLAYISEQFSEFIRANNIVGISAFQLNDNSTKQQNPIGLSRIGRSKLIAHNFNFVWQIEKRKNEENFPDMMVHMIKSRRSELAVGSLSKDLKCCRILDPNKKSNNFDLNDISSSFIDI
jgi:replicative DNA helicase